MANLFDGVVPRRDVLVLGAGFSRALSSRMPLTDELGNACLQHRALRGYFLRPPRPFRNANFELWLSELAEDQPYLDAAANRENNALFLRFSQAIADVLGDRVVQVLEHPWPRWLPVLLKVAHVTRSTIVTFNYDTLIECAAATGVVFDPTVGVVTWTEVIDQVPPWARNRLEARAEPPDTMSLLKLHGSLNWYWSPGDASGVSVARRVLPGRYGDPQPYSDRERSRELPGRVPLVVPPTATKAPFYTNPIVREVWTRAARAMREADRIVFAGYSLPVTDLTFNAMFRRGLDLQRQSVLVADTSPDGVASRIADLGCPVEVVPAGPEGPIAQYVYGWSREVAEALVSDLVDGNVGEANAPMVVAWGQSAAAAVTKVTSDGPDVLLTVDAVGPAPSVRHRKDERLPTLSDAVRLLATRGAMVVSVSADPQPVLRLSVTTTQLGYGNGVWNVLMPSGAAPTPGAAIGTPPQFSQDERYLPFSMG